MENRACFHALRGDFQKLIPLNSLCKWFTIPERKLTYLGIINSPASSTLAMAQLQGVPMKCLAYILLASLATLPKGRVQKVIWVYLFNKEATVDQIKLVDSTTLSLFTDVFKGGRT